MVRPPRRGRIRATAVAALGTYLAVGCQPVNSLQFNAAPLTAVRGQGQLVRFEDLDGQQFEMRVESVNFPYVVGTDRGARVRMDLRHVKSVAIASQQHDDAATSMKYLTVAAGSYAAVVLTIAIIVALTKTSCPFFYVQDRGQLALVGEAYSGAAFRSIARDDLLPTPLPAGPGIRALLANEANETQLTDRLELVLADHRPAIRVLSTFNAQMVAVGPSVPPLEARDQDGRDVGELVQAPDDRPWQTDLSREVDRPAPSVRESLELTFRPPAVGPADGVPVLELLLGNTPWIDAVMGRFFALMGDRLESLIGEGNDPKARGKIQAWREREGVDLRVELEVGGELRTIAVIPTVGPMALRRVAVPLPASNREPGATVRVRVSGGLGFWRIDQATLSRQSAFDVRVTHLAPSAARDPSGKDWRDALRAVDGTSHVLGDRGDRLELEFEPPPIPPGRERSAFLFTHGYYNVHRPPEGKWSPLALRKIRDRPGALAEFGLDLLRGYQHLLASGERR